MTLIMSLVGMVTLIAIALLFSYDRKSIRLRTVGMTPSQLFAVMCGGLASVAGSVLAGYAAMGVPMEYLVAASFMALSAAG